MKTISVIVLVLFVTYAKCAKILVMFPMPSHSHFTLGNRLATTLAEKGHQVTFVNPYPQKTPTKNLKEVIVTDVIKYVENMKKNLFDMEKDNPLTGFKLVLDMGNTMTNLNLGDKSVQKLLNSGETFDVVIVEHFLCDAAAAVLSQRLKAPIILIAPMGSSSLNNYVFGNPAPSSYVAHPFGEFTKNMNFWQRLANLGMNMVGEVFRAIFYMPFQREIFKKHSSDPSITMDDIIFNTSLILMNSHVSVSDAKPHVPSMIDIGGFHISPTKKLPVDIQKFLDDAKQGVILFSMGSNLKSKDMKLEVRQGILKAFSKLKQKVLWKFEEELPNLPANVKIMSWLPQQDILAHPNVVAFITHGGLLSTLETVYFGKPIIGIPVFGDQKSNMASAVSKGYAVSVPLPELSEETLTKALNELLSNPKYAQNVQARSRIMHDQPLKPMDTAVFWIEHVIRHKGAPHLRCSSLDLEWYQRDMLDIALFLTLVTITLFIIFYIISKKILGLCCGAKKTTVPKSKKRN